MLIGEKFPGNRSMRSFRKGSRGQKTWSMAIIDTYFLSRDSELETHLAPVIAPGTEDLTQ